MGRSKKLLFHFVSYAPPYSSRANSQKSTKPSQQELLNLYLKYVKHQEKYLRTIVEFFCTCILQLSKVMVRRGPVMTRKQEVGGRQKIEGE